MKTFVQTAFIFSIWILPGVLASVLASIPFVPVIFFAFVGWLAWSVYRG